MLLWDGMFAVSTDYSYVCYSHISEQSWAVMAFQICPDNVKNAGVLKMPS